MTGAVPATMTAGQTVNPAEALPPDAVVVGKRRLLATNALAAVLAVAFLALLGLHFTQAPAESTVTRFSFAPEGLSQARISPDGKYILYAARADGESSLWLRPLGDESARQLAGTEGAIGGFWSPDSSWIGFGTASELKRVSIDGGSPITLGELPATGQFGFWGLSWSPDGERIVFSSGLRMYEIAARGGQPQLLFDSSDSPRPYSVFPYFLPTHTQRQQGTGRRAGQPVPNSSPRSQSPIAPTPSTSTASANHLRGAGPLRRSAGEPSQGVLHR